MAKNAKLTQAKWTPEEIKFYTNELEEQMGIDLAAQRTWNLNLAARLLVTKIRRN